MIASKSSDTRRQHLRTLKSNFMVGLTILATLIALVPLFLVLAYLLGKGESSINRDFFTKMPAPVGRAGGGMVNAAAGTFELVALAIMMGVPLGLGAGTYPAERPDRRLAGLVRLAAEL